LTVGIKHTIAGGDGGEEKGGEDGGCKKVSSGLKLYSHSKREQGEKREAAKC